MNRIHTLRFLGLAALTAAGACTTDGGTPSVDSQPVEEGQGSFNIVVAPFEIDSLAKVACYNVAVSEADGTPIWSETSLCTDDWSLGNEGTFTYVGICEAGLNTVTIELTSLLSADSTELGNWDPLNPPTYTTTFTCTPNADTVVRANFLVLTQGTKGFLDVQVSVQEIACNAKVDCNDDFLGDDLADASVGTIVVAIACESNGADFTQVMLDDIILTCTDEAGAEVEVAVETHVGVGVYAGYPDSFVSGVIGNAGVSADGTSYWTVALGVSPGWTDCHLDTRMAANDGRDMTENDQFPIIVATNIPFGFDDTGIFSCATNPLDGLTSGLFTTWGSATDLDFSACLNEDGTVSICL